MDANLKNGLVEDIVSISPCDTASLYSSLDGVGIAKALALQGCLEEAWSVARKLEHDPPIKLDALAFVAATEAKTRLLTRKDLLERFLDQSKFSVDWISDRYLSYMEDIEYLDICRFPTIVSAGIFYSRIGDQARAD